MNIQLVNISLQDVFKKYSSKYNIFRDLYEPGIIALEMREIPSQAADEVQRIVLERNEICYKITNTTADSSSLLIMGTIGRLKDLAREIVSHGNEDIGYKTSLVIRNFTDYDQTLFQLPGNNRTCSDICIMGILNVTPDSFSDGGKYYDKGAAVRHALEMLDDGADIIDIGGESSRPGSEGVDADEELRRIIPVLEDIKKHKPDAVISVDTTKSIVALEALKRGARIVNDISGFSFDHDLLKVVKKYDAVLVIMHMKGIPREMQKNPYYDEVVSEVYDYLNQKITLARKAGVKHIIIDPGIGFGKRFSDNYELIKRLDEFKGLGYPILVGLSRKAFLGKTTGLDVKDRDTATVIAESLVIQNGARIIRTHNVKNAVQARKILKCVFNPDEALKDV